MAKTEKDLNALTTGLPQTLPMGWSDVFISDSKEFFEMVGHHALGWIATILAITMGAPFWFDLLNKVANLRGVGPKPANSGNSNVKNT